MSFAHPWMLLGAAGALIPLLVHLFDRRRARPHPFAAIAFVLRSQKRTASRLKLKRLLLYLLRTLILLALPLALARPDWTESLPSAQASRGPAATAIVLDGSLAMRYAEGQTLFDRGREEANRALSNLVAEEPATFLLCTSEARPPAPASFDRRQIRLAIDEAQPSFGRADLNRCLDLAGHSLEDAPLAGKRLVVISAFTSNALRVEVPTPVLKGTKGEALRPEFVLRDVAEGRPTLPNRAVTSLKIEPILGVAPRTFQFTFTVKNFSLEAAKDLPASLRVGDRVVAKGFVDVAAGGTAQKTLSHRFDNGGNFSGSVSIGPDGLAEDNERAFVLRVPNELKALVINGAPSSVRYRDEAFFVEAALASPGTPVKESLRDAEAGFREPFEDYDLVFLLNTPPASVEDSARLVDFVEKGGGLFISLGDRVDSEVTNQRLGKVLPSRLRLLKTAVAPGATALEARAAARLTTVDWEHPVFSTFSGASREGLLSARFSRYMLLEPLAAESGQTTQVLAAFDDGMPAMVLGVRGAGRVLLYTSTVDRDWSDLPIRTSFLPLVQRLSAFLAGAWDEGEDLRAQVGGFVALRVADHKDFPREFKAPSGQTFPVAAPSDEGAKVGPLRESGLHRAYASDGRALERADFAAGLDPQESDLGRIKPEALAAYFGEETTRQMAGPTESRSTPLWTWLILVAALAYFFEGTLLKS